MKKMKLAVALVAGLAVAGGAAKIADAYTAGANAIGRIRAPITFSQTADLDFGTITSDGLTAAASAIVNSDGTAGAVVGGTSDNATAAGLFTVNGAVPNAIYDISAVGGVASGSLTGCAGGACPAAPAPYVDNFTFETLSMGPGTQGQLGPAPGPTDTLQVGGQLFFDGTTHDGDYTGTFQLTVVYN